MDGLNLKTTVYLIRHAEAAGNVGGFFQGHTNSELTEKGYKQLEYLKERCKEIPFEVIYCSPLIRTIETAKAVNYYHDLPINTHEGLKEINGGLFEGKLWEDLPKLYPEEYKLWEGKHYEFDIEYGESMREVYARMRDTVTKIADGNRGKIIGVVSHGCAIRNFLCYASGYPIEKLDEMGWSDNTAISCVEFDDELNPHIVFKDDSQHLDEESSTMANQTWWK